jgi:Na+-translocating ferredoxin:NAD+ oxidoreductase RnfG subunit
VPFAGGMLLGAAPAALQAQLSLDEALQVAFPPPATVERRTAFLTRQDLEAARAQAGAEAPLTQRVVTYYVARQQGRPVGVAYFDSHRVRTLKEVVMIVIIPPDRIRNIEVLRFAEPPEYHARDPWLRQFEGKTLDAELSLKGSIANMTGATLTSNAIVRAARRILALHGRIHPFQSVAESGR